MSAKKNNRSLFPVLLMGAGIVLIIASLIWVLSLTPTQETSTIQPTNTVGVAATRRIPYSNVPRVALVDAKDAFDLEEAVFIDTRGEPYYSEGHIPGALSIPESELQNRLSELKPSDWIIAYCT